ncbi:MAG: MBL fold metallo-hydrolase [Prevotellaceae bacterium]|nr:MBL fold metallo-hydrolase [Prevotellaceae bacterium]
MMNLTYIFHSCFMLETNQCIIVFDYWKDPEGVISKCLSTTNKRVYFLASHFHPDHYNSEILQMDVPNGEKIVILSHDIVKHKRARKEDADVFLRRGETYKDDYIQIKAYGSTDVGVSFMLDIEGKEVFHAGDLNNWHWEHESTPQEIKKMEGDFKAILRDIRAEHPSVFLVMFPIDPRLKIDFGRGARQWLETIHTTYIAPMHFPPAQDIAMTFGKEAESFGVKFLYIHNEGERILTIP